MYDAAISMGDDLGDLDATPEDEPKEMVYLLDIWSRVKRRDPITYSELSSYCDMNGVSLYPWESNIIIDIDRTCEALHG